MSSQVIGAIGVGAMLVLLALGMPLAFLCFFIGFVGIIWLMGVNVGFHSLAVIPWANAASWCLAAIPLFILMGMFTFHSGISADLYNFANKWVGRMKGGLGIATMIACGVFAAASGTTTGTAVTIGTVAIPEMRKYGYDPKLAAGTVAAGGTLGILIPPSATLVIYGVLVEQSVGKLLLAGILPGILLMILFSLTVYVIGHLNPHIAPPGTKFSRREMMVSIKGIWPILLLFLLVIGSIYSGMATATEAAAMGAFGAFLVALSKRCLNWPTLGRILTETVRTCGMIFMIVIGAMVFTCFLALSNLPTDLAQWLTGLSASRYVILLFFLAMYLILGCFLNALAMLLLTVPTVYPIIMNLGFNPIWFGIIIIVLIETAQITPPVGMNIYVIAGLPQAKDIPLEDIFKGVLVFIIPLMILLVILILVPQVALILPNTMIE